ncbi:MAG: HlyD family efflux transporter periplasmic adaptor subunit [Clostridia bacterium]|nr:HlyD family efflux transporter periplasmic adaptor subunit [Clostridia bacterium]
MKNAIKRIISIAAACALLGAAALADTISFSGTVAAGRTSEIYAPIGGTVGSVEVEVGQQVSAGDVIATLTTEKVYASEAGTITGVFGQGGDNAETVSQKYGAVMYIEGESKYTIAASTEEAYNKTANKFVSVGEEVLLSCYSDGGHSGKGVITAIEGTNYTVEVTEGEFIVGETVSVFRDIITSTKRIGRGDLTRKNPTAVTASGSIVSIAVQDGDSVERGQLLLETLSGSFDGLYMSGSQILASEDGVIAQLNLEQGGKLEKGSVAAVLYPADSMRIEGAVEEANLGLIAVGDEVEIELIWNQDNEITYSGVVRMISSVANSGEGADMEGDVTYNVYVDFTPDAGTRYGMSAIVTTVDGMAEEAAEDVEAE